ncbi:hypothetical protein BACCOPRO_02700 [Phocaeicola coprophilus DSM 18228 = JCM 13818]|uniref:Uncharacterized protein n=1 Tax=Phocaeicola coprophilus DSM 18228 = JCM 13818 TaxID=547042 RepID=S0FBI8_9BACT|nr:hypothetical protein BACCOPRO_02700 [Phocaeicola coprophilus DSM 18228 = JCM 13818]
MAKVKSSSTISIDCVILFDYNIYPTNIRFFAKKISLHIFFHCKYAVI